MIRRFVLFVGAGPPDGPKRSFHAHPHENAQRDAIPVGEIIRPLPGAPSDDGAPQNSCHFEPVRRLVRNLLTDISRLAFSSRFFIFVLTNDLWFGIITGLDFLLV